MISFDISKAANVFLLCSQCSVSITLSLHGLLAFYLINQLQLGSMTSSLGPFYRLSCTSALCSISPVLFILFINDLLSSTSSSIFSFTNDTYLTSSFSSNPQYLAYSNMSPHCSTSASLLTSDLTNVERLDSNKLVTFNQK